MNPRIRLTSAKVGVGIEAELGKKTMLLYLIIEICYYLMSKMKIRNFVTT